MTMVVWVLGIVSVLGLGLGFLLDLSVDLDLHACFSGLIAPSIALVSIRTEVTTQAHYVISMSNCL